MKKDYDWISRVIDSCENEDHLSYIPAIISLFDTKHRYDNPQATDSLKMLYVDKQISIGALPH